MDTYEPIQKKDFRRRFGGMKAKRTVVPAGNFGEMRYIARLQVKDGSGDVVYEERRLIK